MDWITKLRKTRISGKYEKKYGPWTPENFKDRNPISEAEDELIDCLNYLEMSEMKGVISRPLLTGSYQRSPYPMEIYTGSRVKKSLRW